MSAPPSRRSLHENKPLWVNPCGGIDNDSPSRSQDYEFDYVTNPNDAQILDGILVSANNALEHAKLFRDEYVQKTFNLKLESHHNDWKGVHYDWLPSPQELPKNLGEPTEEEHLGKVELNEALQNTYEYLQKMAVGLEQVAWDQKEQSGDFMENFKDVEYKLRAVLCEIQTAMVDRQVTQREDVTREIMNEEFRVMNETNRKLRDWFIFRDYMNCLEYIIEVFSLFKSKMAPS